MAASKVLSSAGWLLNPELFNASLEAGYIEKSDVERFIQPEFTDKVFRGFKQFFYWAGRFQDRDNKAVLTFTTMGQEGLMKPNIKTIHHVITSLLGKGNILNINYTENPNFVSLVLSSSHAAQIVRQEVAEIDGAHVCYISPRLFGSYQVRILWSPLFYPIEGIVESLKPWCKEAVFKYEEDNFSNGESISTNRVSGKIILKEGVALKQLPHIVKLHETTNKYALLVIRDRDPICLKCRIVGHVRKHCSNFKCIKCNLFHAINSTCPRKTFASTVSNNFCMESDKVGFEHLSDNFENRINYTVPFNGAREVLTSDPMRVNDNSRDQFIGGFMAEDILAVTAEEKVGNNEDIWLEVRRSRARKGCRSDPDIVNLKNKAAIPNPVISNNKFAILEEVSEWGQSESESEARTNSALKYNPPKTKIENTNTDNKPGKRSNNNGDTQECKKFKDEDFTCNPVKTDVTARLEIKDSKSTVADKKDHSPDGSVDEEQLVEENESQDGEHSISNSDATHDSEEDLEPVESFPTSLPCYCGEVIDVLEEPKEEEYIVCSGCSSQFVFDFNDRLFHPRPS